MVNAGYFVECGDVMPNKLGIDNAKKLEEAEYRIANDKIGEMLATYHPQKFDFACLSDIHHRLFADIYDFAGQIRTVNIAKPDSPIPFCYADFIPQEAGRIFGELAQDNYLVGLTKPQFAEKLTYYASELNALHPFREGNGRTTRLYLMLLARNAGYLIDFSLVSRRAILYADAAAFAGNLAPLQNLYRQIIVKI